MYKFTCLLILQCISVSYLLAQSPTQIKVLQSYFDKNKVLSYYNMLKVNDKYILLLRDSVPMPDSTSQATHLYIAEWLKDRGSKPVDGEDYFIFNRGDYNNTNDYGAFYIDGMKFESSEHAEYNIRWSEPFQAKLKILEPFTQGETNTIVLGAILYCCAQHNGPQHCGEDKEKLKTEHGCSSFTIKL